jgi:HK97 family phage prohead protease
MRMEKIFLRAYMVRKDGDEGAAGEVIRFKASTEGVKRDGLMVDPQGWKLDNFRKNPVFLWVHDYFGRNLPIGKVTSVNVEDKTLVSDVVFDQEDEFARAVERKYRTGFLNAVSVGWNTVAMRPSKGGEAPVITEAELLDISAVPVPGDPDALMEREGAGLRALYRQLRGLVEEDEEEETLEHEGHEGHEGSQRAFEGRAGAVLNKRNRGDLEQAVTLIQGVLERAKKEEAADSADDADEADEERGEVGGEMELGKALETLRMVSEKINQLNVHIGGA